MKLTRNNISLARHVVNLMLFVVLAVSLPNLFEYVIYQVTPFEFNVNHTYRHYDDVCLGDTVVLLTNRRTVRPATGVPAKSTSELVRFVGDMKIETDWKEIKDYLYQKNGGATTTVEVRIPELPLGTYGFTNVVTINPSWGIEKTKTFWAEDAKFNVITCDQ